MTDKERIAELARLRQRVCEEILAYGASKREGPDLTITLDRIFTAFELGYTRQPESPQDYDPQAERFSWFIEHGWTPPEEAKDKLEGKNGS